MNLSPSLLRTSLPPSRGSLYALQLLIQSAIIDPFHPIQGARELQNQLNQSSQAEGMGLEPSQSQDFLQNIRLAASERETSVPKLSCWHLVIPSCQYNAASATPPHGLNKCITLSPDFRPQYVL
eukprot:559608-Pelagomonas_calceolata.AAC.4